MARARIYLPAGAAQVEALLEGALPAGAPGFAVASGASEEREHQAWVLAADAAHVLVEGQARAVVISGDVDVQDVDPQPADDPTECVTTAPLTVRAVVSLHVDEDPGSGVEDLLWFDVTELTEVAKLVARR